jgi:predicted Ser/Thr protein kinase
MPATPTPSEREQRLERILADYLHAVEAGTPPDRALLLEQHPDLAADLGSFFRNRDAMERIAEPIKEQLPALAETIGASDAPSAALGTTIRYFGDYELLEEIARGGMGVVYKARQVSLDRYVAVKMILAGQFASAADVGRFRAEAEAAANLDHPNVLPIYEVNEHEGQQYFSMKLVKGGSLAGRVAELVRRPRDAAALVARLARAVYFAHQRGILHRDLKPANILMDPDGTPYITDFGLAKRMEKDKGLTQSGAVVGTPSYMPPEQARAEKQLTTATDVYALGAILYELLTGRPPFQAATAFDVILQVLEQEPQPPRQLQASVDRDLETVVLKCLAKQPGRRYESAAALADDLERWLAGVPVAARPLRLHERLDRWARRHPAQAILTLALLFGMLMMAAFVQPNEGGIDGTKLVVSVFFGTVFMAWMIYLARGTIKNFETRLRYRQPASSGNVNRDASVSPSEEPTSVLARRDLLRAMCKGGLIGAVVGAGFAMGVDGLPWRATPFIRGLAFAVSVSEVVLAGAVLAVLKLAFVRPFGPIPWLLSFLGVTFFALAGADGWQMAAGAVRKQWLSVWLLSFPLWGLFWDWWTRLALRAARKHERSGKVASDKVQLLATTVPGCTVKLTPLLLMCAGVFAGHFAGAALGELLAAEHYRLFGAAAGGLLGRLLGGLLGGLLAVALLCAYRVEAGKPWPGNAGRPYPRGLAVLNVLTMFALLIPLLLMRPS